MTRIIRACAVLFAFAACGDSNPAGTSGDPGTIYVINGAAHPVRVVINGVVRIDSLGTASVGAPASVAPGINTVELRALGVAGAPPTNAVLDVTVGEGRSRYVSALTVNATLDVRAIVDTGAVPAPGMAKLRVINLARDAGPLDIWRTQPNLATPTQLMTPFAYGEASAHVESTPGLWEVIVTRAVTPLPENPRAVSLATIAIFTGADIAATVVVLDAPGNWVRLALLDGSN